MIQVFKLSNSSEISEIGYNSPQVRTVFRENFDYWGTGSSSMTPLMGKIDFRPVFPYFILADRAKLTDLLDSDNIIEYVMLSKRLFELFKSLNMDEYQYFEEPVTTPSGNIIYYLIYLPTPRDDDFFDWENCRFFDIHDPEKRLFTVSSGEEFRKATNGKVLNPERIVIRSGQPQFDFFRFFHYTDGKGGKFYVSARLKNAMQEAGITGVKFEAMNCYETADT